MGGPRACHGTGILVFTDGAPRANRIAILGRDAAMRAAKLDLSNFALGHRNFALCECSLDGSINAQAQDRKIYTRACYSCCADGLFLFYASGGCYCATAVPRGDAEIGSL